MSPKIDDPKKIKDPENFLVSIKEYRRLKSLVKAMEATNYDQIIVVTCDGKEGWRDLAEHSALIYYYAVCERLGVNNNSKFMSDANSFYTKYDIGYMRTKGLDAVRKNLLKLGLYESERAENEYIHIFKLRRTFTPAEIEDFYRRETERRLKNSLPVDSEVIDPCLWHNIAQFATTLHNKANNNLDKLTSSVNGKRIIELADNLLKNYLSASAIAKNHDQQALKYLKTMRSDLRALTLEIKIISAIKQWDAYICVDLISKAETIKNSLDANIARFAKPPKAPKPPKPAQPQPPKPPKAPELSNPLSQLPLGDLLDKETKS